MYRAIFILLLFVLAGCAAPTPTLVPKQLPPTNPPPTAAPTRVVTLAKATPLPKTATPTVVITLPSGAVLVTVSGEEGVNLRGGPGALYPIVTRVANHSTWPAVARSEMGEWLLLESKDIPGGQAWVFVGLTDYNGQASPLPAATPAQTLPAP